jgi:hypothetical protein
VSRADVHPADLWSRAKLRGAVAAHLADLWRALKPWDEPCGALPKLVVVPP